MFLVETFQCSPPVFCMVHTTLQAGTLKVSVLDVGQGDSILIQSPAGKTMLIDAGDTDAGSRVVADLKARGVTSLDAAVASHAHADHIGGYQAVLSQFSVGTFYDSGYPSTSFIYENLLTTIDQKNITFIPPTAGQTIDLDPSVVMGAYEVISPIFEETEPIFTAPAFLPGKVFPMRVKPLPDISESVPFKPLVPALSFIKNKVMWSGSIRGAMRMIPEEDYQQNVAGGKGN